jgi:hypothetical protein
MSVAGAPGLRAPHCLNCPWQPGASPETIDKIMIKQYQVIPVNGDKRKHLFGAAWDTKAVVAFGAGHYFIDRLFIFCYLPGTEYPVHCVFVV